MSGHRDTPDSIRAARRRLASAREALRDRPREQTLESLCSLLERWRDPDSQPRRQLEAELPGATGMHPATLREGLRRALERFSGKALRELVAAELGPLERHRPSGFEQTSVVLAGTIPMPSLLSLLLPLVVHSPVLVKTASRDPQSARLFVESLTALDPELGRCVEVVSFPGDDSSCRDAFARAGCLVATGSDETIAALSARVHPTTRLVAYRHRLSLVALGPRALRDSDLAPLAERLALDVSLWDQQGCLSPLVIFCEGAERGRLQELGAALTESLGAAEERWPRGEVPDAARAAIRRERDEAEMRRATGRDVRVLGSAGTSFTVICEDDPSWRPAPLYRFVRIQPTEGRGELLRAIAEVSAHLAAVAIAGFDRDTAAVAEAIVGLGASRVCTPGTLQAPPLGWHRDGMSPLLPLVRLSDVEVGD